MLADVICYWKMPSFMALDGITSFLRLKDVTNTGKRMRRSLSAGGSSSVQWRKETSNERRHAKRGLNVIFMEFQFFGFSLAIMS